MTVFIIKKEDLINIQQDEISIQLCDDNVVQTDIKLKAFHSIYFNNEKNSKTMMLKDLKVKLFN